MVGRLPKELAVTVDPMPARGCASERLSPFMEEEEEDEEEEESDDDGKGEVEVRGKLE